MELVGLNVDFSNLRGMVQYTSFLQVRKYEPFIVVETSGDKLAGSAGFNTVAG